MFKIFLIACFIASSHQVADFSCEFNSYECNNRKPRVEEPRVAPDGYHGGTLKIAMVLLSASNTNSSHAYLKVRTINQTTEDYDIIFEETPNTNDLEFFTKKTNKDYDVIFKDSPNNNTLESYDIIFYDVPEIDIGGILASGLGPDERSREIGVYNLCEMLDKRENILYKDVFGDFTYKVSDMIFPNINTSETNKYNCTYQPGTTMRVKKLEAFFTNNPRITIPIGPVWYLLAQILYRPLILGQEIKRPFSDVIMNVVYRVTIL